MIPPGLGVLPPVFSENHLVNSEYRSVGRAGETRCVPSVCTACKLSKSILKSKKCKIQEPIYRS